MMPQTPPRYLLLIVTYGMLVSISVAQPGGDRERPGRGFGPPGGGAMGFLMQDAVRKELQLTEDQIDQIDEVVRSAMDGVRQRFTNFRDLSDEERQSAIDAMRQDRDKLETELRDKIKGLLNSDQASRFAELEFQYLLQQGEPLRALRRAGVPLEEDKAEAIRAKQEAVSQRLQAEIARLRAAANQEVLGDALNPAQLDQLMGKPFSFESGPPDRRRKRPGTGPGAGRSERRSRPDQPDDDSPESGERRRRRE